MSAESLQKQLSDEVAKFNQLQNDAQKVIRTRQQLDGQLTENNLVKEELDLLNADARVFKLIGPALIKQNLKESRENVNNRIKYITDEIKRHEGTIKDIEKKQEEHRENIRKIQAKAQQLQQSTSASPSAAAAAISPSNNQSAKN